MTITALAVKDGSATQARVEIAPQSMDTVQYAGAGEQPVPCPYAGKSIIVTLNADESITNDFKSAKQLDDDDLLDSTVIPDGDYYPDHPVAVGQTWDVGPKAAKHAKLGPKDRLRGRCRLDSVKTIQGKQYAQISCSTAMIQEEEGNVEEITETTGTLLVDIAAGMIVQAEQTGKSTMTTDPHAPTQVTGGTEFTYHMRTDTAPAPTTQP